MTPACPGCGLKLDHVDGVAPENYSASPACWATYGELTAYNMQRADPGFLHQLAVDAYAAQHDGPSSKAIATAFGLIGLYLTFEQGFNGREVQHAHAVLAGSRHDWPRLAAPPSRGGMTVADVMAAPEGDERDDRLREWARQVWLAWSEHHAIVGGWLPDPQRLKRPSRWGSAHP
ncbi:DUF5946 family protein [Deinococcus terrestris]|uniref:DUF5946 family protein n=1 Tax=Deinococcus terrestris TaxID=2651870 RepID=UPI0018837C3B|nr:DUF5946 family protein [Deinococcus terrestris]